MEMCEVINVKGHGKWSCWSPIVNFMKGVIFRTFLIVIACNRVSCCKKGIFLRDKHVFGCHENRKISK